jgi:hypothetical protein
VNVSAVINSASRQRLSTLCAYGVRFYREMARSLDLGESQGGLTGNQSKTVVLLGFWAVRCASCVPHFRFVLRLQDRPIATDTPTIPAELAGVSVYWEIGRGERGQARHFSNLHGTCGVTHNLRHVERIHSGARSRVKGFH